MICLMCPWLMVLCHCVFSNNNHGWTFRCPWNSDWKCLRTCEHVFVIGNLVCKTRIKLIPIAKSMQPYHFRSVWLADHRLLCILYLWYPCNSDFKYEHVRLLETWFAKQESNWYRLQHLCKHIISGVCS